MAEIKVSCALCGKQISHNVYYCPRHHWYLCWDHLKKAIFTNTLACPKCGTEVSRVD
jgi:endogenous inhibitor of DNA gyrase (YacG/DUF329 family)